MARAKGIKILAGRATIYEPTENYSSWRVVFNDRVTGKRKTTAGGTTREQAESKAATLLGDYVPNHKTQGETPPNLDETFQNWMNSKQQKWVSRTYDNYQYVGRKFVSVLGSRPITQIAPKDIKAIDTSGLSRGQQEKLRTIVRSTFGYAEGWIEKTTAEKLAQAVTVTGTKSEKRTTEVSKGDIPSSKLVASLVITAAHTCQIGLLDLPDTEIDEMTGEKQGRTFKMQFAQGFGLTEPTNREFTKGLPQEIVESHRRGMPKHYKNREQRRTDETKELAERYRQIALVTALGAGGGLRIGEVLALRVKHFLTKDQISTGFFFKTDQEKAVFDGTVQVLEQASQASKGKIWVTLPKSERTREVHLPAFLPNWNGFGVGTQRMQISQVVPRFSDETASFWTATQEENRELWAAGFTPLNYLLMQRFRELWNSRAIHSQNMPKKIKNFSELLLFPTRNRARQGATGTSTVQTASNWNQNVQIVEGTGTYQAQSNYAKLTNPLYDHVAEIYDEYPSHRTNSKTRNGWTHHGLRHYSISSRIKAGVPLPTIARESGHKDAGFTLERYGHVLDLEPYKGGFEY